MLCFHATGLLFWRFWSCSQRSVSQWWLSESSSHMRQNMKMQTHADTEIQGDTSQGSLLMSRVKPRYPPFPPSCLWCHLSLCLWKKVVWSGFCASVAGSHSSWGCGLIWDLPGRKNTAVCRQHQSASHEPLLCFLYLPRLHRLSEKEKGIRTPRRKREAGFSAQDFISASAPLHVSCII